MGTDPESTREPEEKLARKEELALADCITCPSEFVCNPFPPKSGKTPCLVALRAARR